MENDERVLGEHIGVSIGTAIPLEETLLVDDRPDVDIWINLRTLFRNYYNSYTVEPSVASDKLVFTFAEEVLNITTLLSQNNYKVQLYLCDELSSYPKLFPYSKMKDKDTATKRIYTFLAIENIVIKATAKMLNRYISLHKLKIQAAVASHVYMLTHVPSDLLSRYSFNELSLLESHTGRVKAPNEWITKLVKHPDYQHLPFNTLTLTVFGDGPLYIYGQSITVKKDLLKIATTYKWTPFTTKDKIVANLKASNSPNIKMFTDALLLKLP